MGLPLAFTQLTAPVGGVPASTLLALAPVVTLLVLLAVFKLTAWLAAIGGSLLTVLLAIFAWNVPAGKELSSYGLGSATGAFDRFKQWLIVQATADIRVQTILLAWAFGALLEGLVGFGYPWAVVAPILIAFAIRTSFEEVWGALLVGVFIFGLAYAFNYSGMAGSMAFGFSKVGTAFIVLSPILGWIAVALSGSNTASNAVFGEFQATVAKLLHAPMLLFPSLNSVGAEVGKPVAPQTASVGVSTTKFVRNEGQVIRHNMAWTLIVLVYLIGVGALYYFVLPAAMKP